MILLPALSLYYYVQGSECLVPSIMIPPHVMPHNKAAFSGRPRTSTPETATASYFPSRRFITFCLYKILPKSRVERPRCARPPSLLQVGPGAQSHGPDILINDPGLVHHASQ